MTTRRPQELEITFSNPSSTREEFAEAVDTLLACLLADVPGFSRRATDGVLLNHLNVGGQEIVASGIAVLIDQTVEPFRIELCLGSNGALATGALYFGDAAGPSIPYGSPAHRKLSKAIVAAPAFNVAWKQSWSRTSRGWERNPDQDS